MALTPAERASRWRQAHPEQAKAVAKAYRERNVEKARQRCSEWAKENRERLAQYQRDRYAADLEYRAKKRASADPKAARRWKEKALKTDPTYKLIHTIGCQMRNALKDKGRTSWQELVGYSAEQLRTHLEAQFEPWMNWSNHGNGKGSWNIDHIRPVVSFDLPRQIRECWALANLRPLCAIANSEKRASIA
jgi:hypothetical protein